MTVILGGGISGLSAAYYAINDARLSSVILLEASSRVGGWIRSRNSPSGAIFEQGPRTVRATDSAGANTLNLIEDLQLNDKLIAITSLGSLIVIAAISKNYAPFGCDNKTRRKSNIIRRYIRCQSV